MDGELAGTPFRPLRLHRIYRLRVECHGDRVRLFRRGGHDWSRRFPWIAETARKIRKTQFVIDGEAVVLGVDGISDFNALHSRKHDHEVQLYAFDCLAYDGDDLSRLPLHLRKTNLAQLLRGRAEGIFVAPFEQGEIGPRGHSQHETPVHTQRQAQFAQLVTTRQRRYRPGNADRAQAAE
ncbi:MAG TPA: hypothetical protein VFH89_11650, partial [Sphingomicrobium sp.]|nr:hypothetical protein [Sphingomicrobium sp.]